MLENPWLPSYLLN
jgi:hypothetical protein